MKAEKMRPKTRAFLRGDGIPPMGRELQGILCELQLAWMDGVKTPEVRNGIRAALALVTNECRERFDAAKEQETDWTERLRN